MDVNKFIRNVDELCKIRQTTLTRACLESGVSRTFISDMKSGKTKSPRLDNIEKLANYLGVTVSVLLDENYIKHFTGTVIREAKELDLSDEAVSVAQAYDQADDRTKQIIKLNLAPFGLSGDDQ